MKRNQDDTIARKNDAAERSSAEVTRETEDRGGRKTASTAKRPSGPKREPRNVRGKTTKATAALEDTRPNARPSRKSTRGSSNRAKPDSNLQRRQTRKVTSPKARAARGA